MKYSKEIPFVKGPPFVGPRKCHPKVEDLFTDNVLNQGWHVVVEFEVETQVPQCRENWNRTEDSG